MRAIDADTWDALRGLVSGVRDVWFVEADVADANGVADPLRLWTGLGATTWDGKLWEPAHGMVGIAPMPSAVDGELTACAVQLTATTEILAMVRSYRLVRRALRVWRGFLGPTGALHGEPILVWVGALDTPDPVSDDGQTCVVAVTAESVVADLRRPKRRRLGPAEQKIVDPTDDGLQHLPSIDGTEWKWPKAAYFERMAG